MKNFIVTTTIFNPSLAVKKFAKIKDWHLVIVGDLKTPHKKYLNIKNITYLTPDMQKKIAPKLSRLIGWNCIQRRNIGYIYAKKNGAKLIASVDDDNIPYRNWGQKILINKRIETNSYQTNQSAFDPLSIFKFNSKIWHRGFPLQLLQEKPKLTKTKKKITPDIQANLWDKNPDIDAINRMTLAKENFIFKDIGHYTSAKLAPFNSQNTIFSADVISKYFLFPFVGRMDDIWASYYVQSLGYKVIFDKATVYQDRNEHSHYKDFQGEMIGYNNNLNLILSLNKDPNSIKEFLPKRSYLAFKEYLKIMK